MGQWGKASTETTGQHFRMPHGLTTFLLVLAWMPSLQARAESARFPIDPFVPAKPGSFFTFVQDLSKQSPWGERSLATARERSAAVAAINGMKTDNLTLQFIMQYESYQSALLLLQAQFLISRKQALTAAELNRATTIVLLPDGSRESTPLTTALLRIYGLTILLDQEVGRRPVSTDLSGSYHGYAKGECPFASGDLQIRQHDHILEAVRGDKQLLIGVIGDHQAWFLDNSQRYMTITLGTEKGSAVVDVPDKPSELYRGSLRKDGLDLSGQVHGDCQLTLQRP